MNLGIENKTALITGGSSGIGLSISKFFVENGVNVVISSSKNNSLIKAFNYIKNTTGKEILFVQSDHTTDTGLNKIIQYIQESLLKLDFFIFSTGHPPVKSFSEAKSQDWIEGSNILFKPLIELLPFVTEKMKINNFGRIVLISSIYAYSPNKDSAIQSILRAQYSNLSFCISKDYGKYNITSNVIYPGFFNTPLLRKLSTNDKQFEKDMETYKKYSPLNKIGNPEDIAALIGFICSKYGSFISGSLFKIDGGASNQNFI